MWALISSLIEDLTVCYRRQLLRFHNNMELGIALMKNIICLKNTEKCQILKNFDKFSMFLCLICFLTKVVSTHCITVPFLKSPIRILREVQGPGCHSANTAGLTVTAPLGHMAAQFHSTLVFGWAHQPHRMLPFTWGSIPGARSDDLQTNQKVLQGEIGETRSPCLLRLSCSSGLTQ